METNSSVYDFALTRRQRLCSLVAEWGWPTFILCFCLAAGGASIISHPIVASILALGILFVFRGLLIGIARIFSIGKTHIEIQDAGVGFGRDSADWWIFTDGIKQIRRNRWGTTSIRHHNGTYVDIPTALLSGDDYRKLEAGMKKYRDYWSPKKTQTKA